MSLRQNFYTFLHKIFKMLDLSSKSSAQALVIRVAIGKGFTVILGGIVLALILLYDMQYAYIANQYNEMYWYLERFFVFTAIFCFAMSVLTFGTGLLAHFKFNKGGNVPLKFFDLGYNLFASVMLSIAAIVFLVSTWQIELNVISSGDLESDNNTFSESLPKRQLEKTIAAVVTLANALVCARIAVILGRDRLQYQFSTEEVANLTNA